MDLAFEFTAECWLWQAEKAAWHFVTLPEDQSEEIKFFSENNSTKKRGWGAVKVKATIGDTTWETSIFPHKESNAYILPIKAAVRNSEQFHASDTVTVILVILL